ncbi:MAG: Na/Pi symporter [Gammaproteobacteria bacterium]|nr:Na/Pi symporter [Gammaproteobacteria bacterium]
MSELLNLNFIGTFIGGIGLFLLGMKMMTDGLKMAAGDALRHILSQWTRTPLRGFLSGALITAVVQASGAVTVAAIGFVNAGLLTLLQTVYVIYGTNIGTTMTSWLVALVGFNVDVVAFALPMIGLGMGLRVFSGATQRGALGEALTGFGLFFLGIGILNETFVDVGSGMSLQNLPVEGVGLWLFVGIGFVLTFLMQSSSAALAVTLTAAAGGLIPLSAAAAMVIGANVGTTSTAALAVIGATANAQRIAAAHVIFNLLTGVVALLLLMPLLALIEQLRLLLGLGESVATVLALFHTLFNILGVLLLWFLTPRMVSWLERRLRSAKEDLGRPVYLDKNVVATPSLAFSALIMELGRMGDLASKMLRDAFSTERHSSNLLHKEHTVMERLVDAVNHFSVTMQKANLPTQVSENLPLALRVSRYYMEVAALALRLSRAQEHLPYIEDRALQQELGRFRGECVALLDLIDPLSERFDIDSARQRLDELERHYETLKAQLLNAGAREAIRLRQMVAQLDLYSDVRRAMEQAVKGASYLNSLQSLARSLDEGELLEGVKS